MKNIIQNQKTGILCSNDDDWYISLKKLIYNKDLRKRIGENAYNICKKNYVTIYTGRKLVNHINTIANKHIGFFLPSLRVCGGIYVILKHAIILKDEGWDVDLILPRISIDLFEFQKHKFNVISLEHTTMAAQYDVIVATFYTTLFSTLNYYRTKKHIYLVQGYETDFFPYGNYFRSIAEKTYYVPFSVEYVTISKWCENWLWEKYGKKSRYSPNGIDWDNFSSPSHRRNLKKKKNSYFN